MFEFIAAQRRGRGDEVRVILREADDKCGHVLRQPPGVGSSIGDEHFRHAGKLVTGRQLLQAVWGPQYGSESNYLRVHLAHIRRKLEPHSPTPRYFVTEPGIGYRFIA